LHAIVEDPWPKSFKVTICAADQVVVENVKELPLDISTTVAALEVHVTVTGLF